MFTLKSQVTKFRKDLLDQVSLLGLGEKLFRGPRLSSSANSRLAATTPWAISESVAITLASIVIII